MSFNDFVGTRLAAARPQAAAGLAGTPRQRTLGTVFVYAARARQLQRSYRAWKKEFAAWGARFLAVETHRA